MTKDIRLMPKGIEKQMPTRCTFTLARGVKQSYDLICIGDFNNTSLAGNKRTKLFPFA
jgi:ketopantoate hydroxymethyltransferase